jgi:dTDP-4-dehydrorhamnose 3,5-epimerase
MKVIETALPGVLILEPRVIRDERGHFAETWHQERYAEIGIPTRFVQDNVSYSHRGVLRGLHFQVAPHAQGKLVSVLRGEVYDVAVDLRSESPTFTRWIGVRLSCQNLRQMWIPEGFAHGFLVTGTEALFSYKCTAPYSPKHERSLRWNDPTVGVDWPSVEYCMSEKDSCAPLLSTCDPAEQDSGELVSGDFRSARGPSVASCVTRNF